MTISHRTMDGKIRTTSKKYALQTNNLSVGYKHKKKAHVILSSMDVTMAYGELVCFMGQNGVGKSTLLRTLSGIQPPLAGKVWLGDKDIASLSKKDIAQQLSLVLTEQVPAANLSVYELLTLGRYPYLGWDIRLSSQDRELIDRAIALTHIETLLAQKLHTLSDGQRQKAMIARALVQDCSVMVLDEPTAHLDLNNRIEIVLLLKQLSKEVNKAILMATHELDLALQVADRLWLAHSDGPLLTGIPEDLVLNGGLDDTFRLKGYDLKTGRITYRTTQHLSVHIQGRGYAYLWTKNALERNGYPLVSSSDGAEVSVLLTGTEESPLWQVVDEKTGNKPMLEVDTVEKLLTLLSTGFPWTV